MNPSHNFAQQHSQTSEGTSLRFAYFGTPTVASDTLALLIKNGFVPAVVVTSPDARRGRGLVLTPSPTKTLALAHNIPVLTPDKLDAEALSSLRAYKSDYALVVAYGKIFPQEFIDAFPMSVLNVHYSLLPKYRGATPLESALLAGDATTGVTIQKMALSMDAGDIVAQEATPIAENETARNLRPRLINMGAELLVATLPAYLEGNITPAPQDASQATRAHKLKKEDGLLDLSALATENWTKYRAYADTIGTYFFVNGKRIKITNAELVHQPADEFRVLSVIPEGKRETGYQDWSESRTNGKR